ncbi:MAG: molecular chaperone HtpG [Myxococcota bacterium]|nr:molecular chaperone HtpG [Myxococcota bacterium]
MSGSTEKFEFRSEAQQLLDLMIHSLYSNKEIFLRELISNSSDALDKLRFEAISQPELLDEDRRLGIRIEANSDDRVLSLVDNGVGMTRQEIIDNLGTIARSGTKEFAQKMAQADHSTEGADSLIGQFGVGFYSAFMVAQEVTVVSRHATETQGTRWFSRGDGQFEVSDAERKAPGTTILLKLREADDDNGLPDFTQEWVIRQTVKRYSDFVQYPIELKVTRTEVERDEEGKPVEGAEEKTTVEWETINSMKAIWSRNPSEVTEEEYSDFYKHIAHDWEPPFETISFKAEGTFEYQTLLFIPSRAPFDLFYRDQKFGLQLYVNRVLIKDRAEELVPDWLRFLKGVVDSPDLSLNVSREILQNDRRVGSIKKRIVRKVIDALETIQKDDRDRYESFWNNYGRVLKEGITDREFSDKLKGLLWFETTTSDGKFVSLADYVERMPEDQEAIYYITGASKESAAASPHLEAFKAGGYEVLFLTDPIDEIMVGHLETFNEKPLKSVGRGDVDLGSEEARQAAEEARKDKAEAHASLLESLQAKLDEYVKEIRFSSRLTESAVCLVGGENDMSPGLERLMRQSGQEMAQQKRIMELNPDHAIVATMQSIFDADAASGQLEDYAQLLYGQALIAEGTPIPDPAGFARRVADLMVR